MGVEKAAILNADGVAAYISVKTLVCTSHVTMRVTCPTFSFWNIIGNSLEILKMPALIPGLNWPSVIMELTMSENVMALLRRWRDVRIKL